MTALKRILGEEAHSNDDDSHYNTLEELDLSDIATAIDGSRSINKHKTQDKPPKGKNDAKKMNEGKRFWFW